MARAITASRRRAVQAAAIYCRISDDREGEALGVKRQEEDCRALAGRRDWPVSGLYVDNDRSAYSGKPRPEYQRLMRDIQSGTVDALVVWDLDRLHRSPRELEEFFTICDSARPQLTELASVSGEVDLSTHAGRLHARMMGSVARYESDQKSHRIRRKHEQLAQMGKIAGGGWARPFGYEHDRKTVRAEEAKRIREAADRVVAGESLNSVARAWNEKRLTTSAGRSWHTAALRRMLVSGRIAGLRDHHGEVVRSPDGKAVRAEWPGIITAAQSERLRVILRDPARRTNWSRGRAYLLTGGLVRCGRCAKRLYGRPKADKTPCYVCVNDPSKQGCGGISVKAETIEQFISEAVIVRLDTPALAKYVADEEKRLQGRERVLETVGALEAQQSELATAWAEGRIARAEWIVARDVLQRRLDALTSRLRAEQHSVAVKGLVGRSGVLAKRWVTLSVEQRRAIVAAVIDHVRVGPAVKGRNTFDPKRLTIAWRA